MRLKTKPSPVRNLALWSKSTLKENGFQNMSLGGFPHFIELYPEKNEVGRPVVLAFFKSLTNDGLPHDDLITITVCIVTKCADATQIGCAKHLERNAVLLRKI